MIKSLISISLFPFPFLLFLLFFCLSQGAHDGLIWLANCTAGANRWVSYEIYNCTRDACGGCRNNGLCLANLTCKCDTNWVGPRCDICPTGYGGVDCEININDCDSSPCANGATCVDGVNRFSCQCRAGWNGTLCNNDIDECAVGLCDANGTASCTNLQGGFTCTCKAGYNGTRCTNNINDCVGVNCLNGGTCRDLVNNPHTPTAAATTKKLNK